MKGNNVNIAGNITNEPEEYAIPGGTTIFNFNIAWNERRKDANGEWKDVANFFTCKAFCTDNQAQIVKREIHKGAKVAIIDGELHQESWEKDGKKQSKVIIKVTDPIGGMVVKGKSQSAQQKPAETHNDTYSEDCPF